MSVRSIANKRLLKWCEVEYVAMEWASKWRRTREKREEKAVETQRWNVTFMKNLLHGWNMPNYERDFLSVDRLSLSTFLSMLLHARFYMAYTLSNWYKVWYFLQILYLLYLLYLKHFIGVMFFNINETWKFILFLSYHM